MALLPLAVACPEGQGRSNLGHLFWLPRQARGQCGSKLEAPQNPTNGSFFLRPDLQAIPTFQPSKLFEPGFREFKEGCYMFTEARARVGGS